MNYYIVSDTHFNHVNKMIEYCGRPVDYEERFWNSFKKIKTDDVLIHLGDICMGNDEKIHERLREYSFKKILVKGNHDRQSSNWYMSHGWDFACFSYGDKLLGKNLLFSHRPKRWDGDYDFNVHGHFHEKGHRIGFDSHQILYSSEKYGYKAVKLERVLDNDFLNW